ncbi:conserved hypothetical protein [Candidatus Nitrotoga fabula]|uniref:Uncharacterized protein n=1 Tax=Candidatus Nitrotoga fabula TaxID=2182327 RepID=A0A916FAX2_9PROT|nr:conserved hypothetical protein [Candidatus Nitrotoga fabula]
MQARDIARLHLPKSTILKNRETNLQFEIAISPLKNRLCSLQAFLLQVDCMHPKYDTVN